MSYRPIKRSFNWGILGAVLAPALAGFLLIASGMEDLPFLVRPGLWHSLCLFLLYVSTFALTGMLLFGLPCLLLLRYLGLLSWSSIILASALAGLSYFFIIGLLSGHLAIPPYGLAFSAISGLGFCIGVWPLRFGTGFSSQPNLRKRR